MTSRSKKSKNILSDSSTAGDTEMRIQEEAENNDDIEIMAETLLTKLEQEKKEYGLLLRQQLETWKKLRNARAINVIVRQEATGR